METKQQTDLFNFIWNIAGAVLVHKFDCSDYREIILSFTVLRRFDILLVPTKEAVLKEYEQAKKLGLDTNPDYLQRLTTITGYPFYNVSKFTMERLRQGSNAQQQYRDMLAYLNGFSPNVQKVIEKFDLHSWVKKLYESDRLALLIEKFTDTKINLSVNPVCDANGSIVQPGLDNHTMGTIFEHLLRKFNEEYNIQDAGLHFTPRDYVQLLTQLAVEPVFDKLEDNKVYSIYDGACGTGGILTVTLQTLKDLAKKKNRKLATPLIYGQEFADGTYATCLSDLLISGQLESLSYPYGREEKRDVIAYGSTISQDGHANETFDFCVMNPPFGTPWEIDLENWKIDKKNKKDVSDSRFVLKDGKDGTSFLPKVDDCQMLFLANSVSRMKKGTKLGTRVVEIHDGSSIFTGNAGGGESNLRKYLFEQDLVEAIIEMPENMFFKTEINTYIWILTNRKEARRKGKVQLIDATQMFTPLKKNLGKKSCEVNEENRAAILKLLMDFEETPQSKIFSNKEFGYWAVTVERPLRLKVKEGAKIPEGTFKKAEEQKKAEAALAAALKSGAARDDWNKFAAAMGLKKTMLKTIRPLITERDERAAEVEGEIDSELTDTENIPLPYPGGIEGFMEKEVLPYAPDAKVNAEKTKVGYELSFTKYFYKPVELRGVKEIAAEIQGFEKTAAGLLEDILK